MLRDLDEPSATLLSKQPLSSPESIGVPSYVWDVTFTHLESRLSSLRNWRYSWWSSWSRIAEFILPRRYEWLVVANRYSKGNMINDAIIDSTATLAMYVCASGMWSGLTDPAKPWFELSAGLHQDDLDDDAKQWLQLTQNDLYQVFGQSNFYETFAQMFQDVSTFGTSPVLIAEDDKDVVRFYSYCTGEYYLGVGARLENDTLYTERTYTVLQIVDEYGVDNCPSEVVELWNTGGASLQQEFVVASGIEPNFGLSPRNGGRPVSLVPGKFAFRQIDWLKGQKTQGPLRAKGFSIRPFANFRWSTVSNDAYGRGIGFDVIGDTKQVQQETRRKAEFIEKLIRPPMLADPSLKNEPSSNLPGNITYVNMATGQKGFQPAFEVNPAGLPAVVNDIALISERIKDCFFVNVFMAITQMQGVQPRNELELTKRDQERLQALGPVVNLVTKELDQTIRRVLDIMKRKGLVRPLPPSLVGQNIKIQYNSMLKVAQRASAAVGMKDLFATAGELSSAAQAAELPNPLRTMKLDNLLQKYGDLAGVSHEDAFFTKAEVAQHDAAREKAQQQAQIPGAAMAAVTAAHTLASTPTGGGSALSALMGQPQGA